MPTDTPLTYATTCLELLTSREDWDAADPALLEDMLVQMTTVRVFEEAVLQLAGEGLVHGPAHSSIGQEGSAVGSVLALRGSDGVNGTHRGHHQFLAKGLSFLRPDGLTRSEGIKDEQVLEFLHRTMTEILGLKSGFSGGRGGSMHLQWLKAGALGTNAIVGGGVPLAAGNAWAQRHDAETGAEPGDMDVTVTYFGDGASNIGSTLETFNLAAAWDLPLCFFIENNLYAVSTHVSDVTGEPRLAARGPGFGITSWRVDGMDPLAVYLAQKAAVKHMRSGKGPTLIEAETYRYFHQNGPFPGSAFGYRSKEEEKQWRDRDPLDKVAAEMIRRGLLSQEQREELKSRITEMITGIVDGITEKDPESSKGARRIRPDLWPDPSSVDDGIRAEPIIAGPLLDENAQTATTTRRFVDAIADVLDRRMATDPGVVILGEDVHRLKGGTNGATRGLKDSYPDRVLGTPISENAFAGLGGGLAMTGRYKPIVEFMYSDFLWVAADQVFNQIAKARHMFGGQSGMPVVLRSKVAMGAGYGSQHSMDPAGIFATSPGWRIVAPSTPQDYIGLMNTALDLQDPVLVLEHVDLYGEKGEIPEGDLDYRLPVGRAAIRRAGNGVTVLTYLNMVDKALLAAEQRADLDAEVIDLRWLDRASLDWDTIQESIKKTNNVLIIEQGARGTSYGTWLADEIQRRFFDYLDQPIQRVTGREASPSISRVLEAAANASMDDVLAGFDEVARNLGHS
jgi:2-oxoisovalerate dehydrogenase E1 component